MFLWNENSKTNTAETCSLALWSSSRMTSTVKQVLYELLHIQKCSYQNDLFLWILKLNLILKINKGSVTGFHSVLGCRGCVVLGALLWLFFSFFCHEYSWEIQWSQVTSIQHSGVLQGLGHLPPCPSQHQAEGHDGCGGLLHFDF